MFNTSQAAHDLLAAVIEPHDTVIDATMGNGHDTLFLARLTDGVIAFDLQEAAVAATRELLRQQGLSARLISDGHEKLLDYVKTPIKAAIFNLGYLPQSDKTVVTRSETTLKSLSALTDSLVIHGRIVLVLYEGHTGGHEEKEAVLAWAGGLDKTHWQSVVTSVINHDSQPPTLLCVEKLR